MTPTPTYRTPTQTNRFLEALSPAARKYLTERSVEVDLPVRTVLYGSEEVPSHVYFLLCGMASVVASMKQGGTAEVGVVGTEGVVGGVYLLGPARALTQTFIQLDARGLRISMAEMREAFDRFPEVRERTFEYVQQEFLILSQIAGCNRLHDAEQRLARWLLMARDRTDADTLEFTQEFLALMLGSRRTTVTLMAGTMQRNGLIEYSRGRVRILDREGLEAAACSCYQVTKDLYRALYTGAVTGSPERGDAELAGGRRSSGVNGA